MDRIASFFQETMGILYDLDGSLTGYEGGGTIVPASGQFTGHPQCENSTQFYATCRVNVRRVVIAANGWYVKGGAFHTTD